MTNNDKNKIKNGIRDPRGNFGVKNQSKMNNSMEPVDNLRIKPDFKHQKRQI